MPTNEELAAKHAEERVSFDSYYKYQFTYVSAKLKIVVGGDSDGIYRADLSATMTVADLWHEAGGGDNDTIEEV